MSFMCRKTTRSMTGLMVSISSKLAISDCRKIVELHFVIPWNKRRENIRIHWKVFKSYIVYIDGRITFSNWPVLVLLRFSKDSETYYKNILSFCTHWLDVLCIERRKLQLIAITKCTNCICLLSTYICDPIIQMLIIVLMTTIAGDNRVQ